MNRKMFLIDAIVNECRFYEWFFMVKKEVIWKSNSLFFEKWNLTWLILCITVKFLENFEDKKNGK